MRLRIRTWFLLVLFILGSGQVLAGELGALNLGPKPTDLLAGRLKVRMPEGARIQPRQVSIMAAAQAAEEETRVVLDAGKERLVLMAYEMYALTRGQLEAEVQAFYENLNLKGRLEKLPLKSGLKAVTFAPDNPDMKREAVFFQGVMVAREDTTLQYLVFYANPEASKDLKGALALARKIASSLTPGKRKLKTKAGVRIMAGLDSSYRLSIQAPEGFIHTKQDGPDFMVHNIRTLARLNMRSTGLSIYLGGHPSFQYQQLKHDEKKVKTFQAKLLGKKVGWKRWKSKGKPEIITCEAIVPLPKKTDFPTQVHVFYQTASEKQLKQLAQTAASLKILVP
jgi:hypothetical protein